MPRNGSGVYSLPAGYAATGGNSATASQHNTPLEDIQADLNAARPLAAGGTGASTASAARTALGLGIGSDVQAFSAALTDLDDAGVVSAAGKFLLSSAAGDWDYEDLVGTVSQSSGTPTGSVMQYGSNSNGWFLRLADGTQICSLESVGMAATSAIGSLFRTSADVNWSFPAAFLSGSTPACFGRVTGASRWVSFGGGSHTSAGFRQYSALSDATTYAAQLCAIGRWF